MTLISSGHEVLDHMLGGGLLVNHAYVAKGGPGAGKTIMGFNMANGAIGQGVPVVFISSEVPPSELRLYAKSLGFPTDEWEEKSLIYFMHVQMVLPDCQTIEFDNFEFSPILHRVKHKVTEIGAKLVVFDSFSAFLGQFENTAQARKQLNTLIRGITALDVALFGTLEASGDDSAVSAHTIEEFVVDGVIDLDRTVIQSTVLKTIYVSKLRSGRPSPMKHFYTIGQGGIHVIQGQIRPLTPVPCIETVNPWLNDLLCGGLAKGSMLLVEVNGHASLSPLLGIFLASVAQDKFGMIVTTNNRWTPDLMSNLANKAGVDMAELNLKRSLVFIDRYHSERRVAARESPLTIDEINGVYRDMMDVLGEERPVVVLGDLDDDMNLTETGDFLRLIIMQSYTITSKGGTWVAFINRDGVAPDVLGRVRMAADTILEYWSEDTQHFIRVARGTHGLSTSVRLVDVLEDVPFLKFLD